MQDSHWHADAWQALKDGAQRQREAWARVKRVYQHHGGGSLAFCEAVAAWGERCAATADLAAMVGDLFWVEHTAPVAGARPDRALPR
jgi:ribonuclease D